MHSTPNPETMMHRSLLLVTVLATVVYSVGMIVVFAPLAVRLYRTRTSK